MANSAKEQDERPEEASLMSLGASHSSTPNKSRQIVDASLASTLLDPSASASWQAVRKTPSHTKAIVAGCGTSLPDFVVVEGWDAM